MVINREISRVYKIRLFTGCGAVNKQQICAFLSDKKDLKEKKMTKRDETTDKKKK